MPDIIQKVGVEITGRVSAEEAAMLCAHHLMLAAAYFEASPHDRGLAIQKHIVGMQNEGGQQAASVWIDYICNYYAEMAKAEGDMHDD